MPDADAMADLKRKDPVAHKMWVREVQAQLQHQRFMESAQYKMPLTVIRRSQIAALTALIILAGLAAYALHLDHPWIATLFGTLDVVAIVSVFTNIGRDDTSKDE